MAEPLRFGGVILCGGKSSRMGMPKALLPFGNEVMLQRVVRLLAEAVNPIVVVAAVGQALPELPESVAVAHDQRESHGPLEGIRVGLETLAGHANAAYVTSCDVPLLLPDFVRCMLAELGKHDAAVPFEDGFHHPLAAVYRTNVSAAIEMMLTKQRLRTSDLFGNVKTKRIPVEQLRSVDPELLTLMNANTLTDYKNALKHAAFPIDDATQERQ